MPRLKQLHLLATALVLISPSAIYAQGDAMIELYGAGVHRYFCSDYAGANEVLTKVVDSGSVDPRVYYFRGLAQEMLGGNGDVDFDAGATLEAEGKLVVQVGAALTRIQGAERTKIEIARRDARVAYRQEQLAREAARRKLIPQPAVKPEAAPAPPSDTSDPFSADGGLRSDATTADPVQPEVDGATDPFRDDPAPAATPDAGSSSPFDAPAGADADNPFGAPAAPADVGSPFGDPAAPADAGNPFGDPAATPPAATPPADAGNPFGDPAAPTPPADAGNPFGDPAPAAGGDADNPFGT